MDNSGMIYPIIGTLSTQSNFMLRFRLKEAVDFTKAHPDKVLWLGEFGTIRHAPPASRAAWMRDVISIAEENGMPWCAWNYLSAPYDGNRFSLVDDDTREILTPGLARALGITKSNNGE